ncbi:MAG TPA: HIT family protein [Burkholderiales bacterium]|nr:HIT family protein [Burkholderiales bacterium]
MSECVFCNIVAGRIPSAKVHEDEMTLAFMDIGEVNPGHVLVTVKPHVENIYGLNDALAAAVFRTAARVARALKNAYSPEGMTLYQANGVAASQTVFHFHIHLVPRHAHDGLRLTWPAKNPSREQLEANAAKVRAALE